MDKPSTSAPPQKPSTGGRVRLIPATPQPEGATPQTTQPVTMPNEGTSQPLETFGGILYSGITKEAMARLNREIMGEEEKNSIESSSENTNPSGIQASPTSSSSLRFSIDEGEGAEKSQGRKRTGRTFEKIAFEVIREMRETEAREEEEKSRETQEAEEPLRVPAEEENRAPQEDPIREILDLTGTDDEKSAMSNEWRNQMEDNVNLLMAENVE